MCFGSGSALSSRALVAGSYKRRLARCSASTRQLAGEHDVPTTRRAVVAGFTWRFAWKNCAKSTLTEGRRQTPALSFQSSWKTLTCRGRSSQAFRDDRGCAVPCETVAHQRACRCQGRAGERQPHQGFLVPETSREISSPSDGKQWPGSVAMKKRPRPPRRGSSSVCCCKVLFRARRSRCRDRPRRFCPVSHQDERVRSVRGAVRCGTRAEDVCFLFLTRMKRDC